MTSQFSPWSPRTTTRMRTTRMLIVEGRVRVCCTPLHSHTSGHSCVHLCTHRYPLPDPASYPRTPTWSCTTDFSSQRCLSGKEGRRARALPSGPGASLSKEILDTSNPYIIQAIPLRNNKSFARRRWTPSTRSAPRPGTSRSRPPLFLPSQGWRPGAAHAAGPPYRRGPPRERSVEARAARGPRRGRGFHPSGEGTSPGSKLKTPGSWC